MEWIGGERGFILMLNPSMINTPECKSINRNDCIKAKGFRMPECCIQTTQGEVVVRHGSKEINQQRTLNPETEPPSLSLCPT